MSESYDRKIADIAAKCRVIATRYKAIRQQRDEALKQISTLKSEIEKLNDSLQSLSIENEHLKLASNIEHSVGDIEKAREFLSKLVWEIDKCIDQLKD